MSRPDEMIAARNLVKAKAEHAKADKALKDAQAALAERRREIDDAEKVLSGALTASGEAVRTYWVESQIVVVSKNGDPDEDRGCSITVSTPVKE